MKPRNYFPFSPRHIALGIPTFIALGLLAGCVLTSVYPYYTAKDVVFEPKLAGRWAEPGKANVTNEFWEFTRAGTNTAYTLTVQDSDEPSEYQAHLFRLKQWTFLDAVPSGKHDDFVPPHYLLKVVQIEPTLRVELMDYNWLSELLEQQPGALRHLRVDAPPGDARSGRLVITAETAELQAFLLQHASDTNAFPEALNLAPQH